MPSGYAYILGSHTGTLYIGVTSELFTRIHQHRDGAFHGFSKTHGCTRLLYYEHFEDVRTAIAREKQLKGWIRAKKLKLIETINPNYRDLSEQWGWQMLGPHESIQEYEARKIIVIPNPRQP